jgi:hypothetical protein
MKAIQGLNLSRETILIFLRILEKNPYSKNPLFLKISKFQKKYCRILRFGLWRTIKNIFSCTQCHPNIPTMKFAAYISPF